ncbi:peroxiredoxin [Aquifex aeolicus]|uniref:thioredoxin-dependent peroxiredoxin n=1 Tax=Aquifex aeolicus (strain VF5) TaxID=224324 RepID=O66763_AQUAE|nr:peroxiredoxin [Aquifex aeolicus]AAC06726.1 bacterioferritin comigratory protein [Aquifex aeolicus VF5]
MKEFLIKILVLLGLAQPGNAIQEGQPAYLFSLNNHEDKVVNLSDYKGKWVVLYFYPKADTPGCTTQAKEYTKLMPEFEKLNVKVFGISTDSVEKIRRFREKYGLTVEFLSDPEGIVAKAYGVTLIAGLCSRDTVIINQNLIVEKIYRGVSPSADPHKVLEYIKQRAS